MYVHNRLRITPEDAERSQLLKEAITEEISGLPDGRMTYGQFATRSMYGYGSDVTGYYTNSSFSPNKYGGEQATDTFGTMVAFPGVGAAIGEIVVIELADLMRADQPLEVIEVGGGDGTLMRNLISGAVKQMRLEGVGKGVRPTMIDRTSQLLDRQRETIVATQKAGNPVVNAQFYHSRIEDANISPQPVGAVVTNELLDMLPFEVAWRTDSIRPDILCVTIDHTGELAFDRAPAGDEHADEAAGALLRNPASTVHSFQTGLLPVMEKLASLIESGVIVTMDYGNSLGKDVQVMRGGVDYTQPLDETNYPGLFDISVTPDWEKIVQWAKARYGSENVEFESMRDFICSSDTYTDIRQVLPRRMQRVASSGTDAPKVQQLLDIMIRNYSSLLIRR